MDQEHLFLDPVESLLPTETGLTLTRSALISTKIMGQGTYAPNTIRANQWEGQNHHTDLVCSYTGVAP